MTVRELGDLPAADPLTSGDELLVVQGGVAKRATIGDLTASAAVLLPPATLGDGADTATSLRTAITATGSGSPNQLTTPGAWVEVDASLSADAGGVVINLTAATSNAGTDTSTLLQIGTGASSSEVAWATFNVGYRPVGMLIVPGFIAAGTRVAVRVLSAAASSQAVTGVFSFLPDIGLAAPTSYGANTATAGGALMSYVGSINTKGAWAEITAATTADIDAIMVSVSGGADIVMSNGGVLVDIGTGAGGAESVLLSNIYLETGSTEFVRPHTLQTFSLPSTVASGTRLAARFQTSSANQGTLDVTVVGAARAA